MIYFEISILIKILIKISDYSNVDYKCSDSTIFNMEILLPNFAKFCSIKSQIIFLEICSHKVFQFCNNSEMVRDDKETSVQISDQSKYRAVNIMLSQSRKIKC